jgi:hypothetical protein
MPLIVMDASGIGGKIHTMYSGVVEQDEDGLIVVDSHDVPTLLAAGCVNVQMTLDEQREKISEMSEKNAERQKELQQMEQDRVERGVLGENPDLMPNPDDPNISDEERERRVKARQDAIKRNEDLAREREEQNRENREEDKTDHTRRQTREETGPTTGSTSAQALRSGAASTPSAPVATPSNESPAKRN